MWVCHPTGLVRVLAVVESVMLSAATPCRADATAWVGGDVRVSTVCGMPSVHPEREPSYGRRSRSSAGRKAVSGMTCVLNAA